MTRKDFELIAEVLEDTKPFPNMGAERMAQWLDTVKQFAAQLHRTNDGFKPAKFLAACGVED